jgi:hypothetical protein
MYLSKACVINNKLQYVSFGFIESLKEHEG